MTRTTPTLEQLDAREVPSANFVSPTPTEPTPTPGASRFAVGTAAGDVGTANVYDTATNELVQSVKPFGNTYTGGVRVATGDLTGDGIDDLVCAAASGAPKIKVYDGATGKVIANCAPSGDPTGLGCHVAVGDVTGDGRADLIVGDGGRGWVSVVRGQSLSLPNYRIALIPPPVYGINTGYTGTRVAVGDVNGDGVGDIVTSAASGAAAGQVYLSRGGEWDQARQPNGPTYDIMTLDMSGTAGGAFVACGDFNNDGRADIAIGRVLNGSARVTIHDGTQPGQKILTAFGYSATEGGVPVAIKTVGGQARLVTAVGGGSTVFVHDAAGSLLKSFQAFDSTFKAGVFVG